MEWNEIEKFYFIIVFKKYNWIGSFRIVKHALIDALLLNMHKKGVIIHGIFKLFQIY